VLSIPATDHQYLDDNAANSYTIKVTVADDDGDSDVESTLVTVANVAPEIAGLSLSAPSISENGNTSLSGTFIDPGTLDPHTVTINWGDGSPNTVLNLAAGVLSIPATSHTYRDDGASPGNGTSVDSYTISVTVTDDDDDGGSGSGSGSSAIIVSNVAPTVSAGEDQTANEGGVVTLSGNYSDAGPLDAHTYTWQVTDGDGNVVASGSGASAAPSQSAPVAALSLTPASAGDGLTVPQTHGYEFVANAAITLTHLAWYDTSSSATPDGLNRPHEIGLWSSDGTLLATASLAAGESGVLEGRFRYVPISPVTLTAGNSYIIAGTNGNDGALVSDNTEFLVNVPANRQSIDPAITIVQGRVRSGSALSFPNQSISIPGPGGAQVGPSFSFVPAASPLTFGSFVPADDGEYTFTLAVTDDDQGTTTAQSSIQVNNVAPSALTLNLSATTINENGSTTISGTFTDPGSADIHTLTIDWGDGAPEIVTLPVGARAFSRTHQYLDDNPTNTASDVRPISVTVADDDNGSTTAATSIIVNNVGPQDFEFTANSIDENGIVTVTGSFTDPGTLDTHRVEIDWRGDGPGEGNTTITVDGPNPPGASLSFADGVWTFTASHQYLDDNPTGTPADSYQIGVDVVDDDHGTRGGRTNITISNVAPELTDLAVTPILENGTATLTGTISDVGSLDTFTVEIDWGNGTQTFTNVPAGPFSYERPYLDDNAADSYPVSITVTDDDGGAVSGDTAVAVTNVAPTLIVNAVSAIVENGIATLTGTISDPGMLDTFTLVVNWGDPLSPADNETYTFAASATGSQSFTLTHQYLDDNGSGTPADSYTISATVRDDDQRELLGTFTRTIGFGTTGIFPEIGFQLSAGGSSFSPEFSLAPEFGLLSPADAGHSFTMTGSATDRDGIVAALTNGIHDTLFWRLLRPANGSLLSGSFVNESDFDFVSSSGPDFSGFTLDSFGLNVEVLSLTSPGQDLNHDGDWTDLFFKASLEVFGSGSLNSATAEVVVVNAAPALVLEPVAPIAEHGVAVLTGMINDPGTLDTFTLAINWGDSTVSETIDLQNPPSHVSWDGGLGSSPSRIAIWTIIRALRASILT
jgi:hypothetical protein